MKEKRDEPFLERTEMARHEASHHLIAEASMVTGTLESPRKHRKSYFPEKIPHPLWAPSWIAGTSVRVVRDAWQEESEMLLVSHGESHVLLLSPSAPIIWRHASIFSFLVNSCVLDPILNIPFTFCELSYQQEKGEM